jgi:hypothetical protein
MAYTPYFGRTVKKTGGFIARGLEPALKKRKPAESTIFEKAESLARNIADGLTAKK